MANVNRDDQPTTANLGTHSNGIDPSAPTTGTEGWGTTPDERKVLSSSDAQSTRGGQMKGNPGDDRTAATQRQEQEAGGSTDQRRPEEKADLSHRTSVSAHSRSTSQEGTAHTFRCTDAGNSDCRWETQGDTEDEVMQRIVEHQRDAHGMTDWTDALRDRVRDSIHRRQAA